VWLYKKVLKEAGKLPPLDLPSMDKFQVSKAIEALKNNEPEEIPLPEEEPF
jgi:predicted SPOUT superfamily RNA methylase MTH1